MSNFITIEGMRFQAPSEDMEPEDFLELQSDWKQRLNTIHKGRSFLNVVVENALLIEAISIVKLQAEATWHREERSGLNDKNQFIKNSLVVSKRSPCQGEYDLANFNPTRECLYPFILFSDYADTDKFNIRREYDALGSHNDDYQDDLDRTVRKVHIDFDDLEVEYTLDGKLKISVHNNYRDPVEVFAFSYGTLNTNFSGFDRIRNEVRTFEKPVETLLKRLNSNARNVNDVKHLDRIGKFTPGKWMNVVYELNASLQSRFGYVLEEIKAVDTSLELLRKKRELKKNLDLTINDINTLGDMGF